MLIEPKLKIPLCVKTWIKQRTNLSSNSRNQYVTQWQSQMPIINSLSWVFHIFQVDIRVHPWDNCELNDGG